MRGLSSCGAWAQLLCDMWDLPGPGIESVFPALASGFLTTELPGKSLIFFLILFCIFFYKYFFFFFLAALGLHCCVRAFSSCGEQGLLFIVVCGLLTAVASLVVEHRL